MPFHASYALFKSPHCAGAVHLPSDSRFAPRRLPLSPHLCHFSLYASATPRASSKQLPLASRMNLRA